MLQTKYTSLEKRSLLHLEITGLRSGPTKAIYLVEPSDALQSFRSNYPCLRMLLTGTVGCLNN